MVHQFDKSVGVPVGDYYLVEVITFGDFEVYQQEGIVVHSNDEQEVIKFARDNNYRIDRESWQTAYISQRKDSSNDYLKNKVLTVNEESGRVRYEWILPNGGVYHQDDKSYDSSKLKDLFISSEAIEDLKAWTTG